VKRWLCERAWHYFRSSNSAMGPDGCFQTMGHGILR
jgi:hypothetical protein